MAEENCSRDARTVEASARGQRRIIVKPEVPLSDAGGVVTLSFEKGSHRKPGLRNDRFRISLQYTELADARRIATSQ